MGASDGSHQLSIALKGMEGHPGITGPTHSFCPHAYIQLPLRKHLLYAAPFEVLKQQAPPPEKGDAASLVEGEYANQLKSWLNRNIRGRTN